MKRQIAILLAAVMLTAVPAAAAEAGSTQSDTAVVEETEEQEEEQAQVVVTEDSSADEGQAEEAGTDREADQAETEPAAENDREEPLTDNTSEAGTDRADEPAPADGTDASAQEDEDIVEAADPEEDAALAATEAAEEEEIVEEELDELLAAKKLKYSYKMVVPSSVKMFNASTLKIKTGAPSGKYKITWSIDPASAGTISGSGVLIAKKSGKIVVTAKVSEPSTGGWKNIKATITVKKAGGWTKNGKYTRYYPAGATKESAYYKGWHETEKNCWHFFDLSTGNNYKGSVNTSKEFTVKGEVTGKKITFGKGHHIFNSKGVAIVRGVNTGNGFYKLDGKWVFVNKKSVAVNGWQCYDGCWKYFSNYKLLTGWHKLPSQQKVSVTDLKTGKKMSATICAGSHHYNANGTLAINCWRTVNGCKFYFNKNGKQMTGWQVINKKTYYITKKTGCYKGFKTIDGKPYYFNQNGVLQAGWQKINGSYYYMNSHGVVQKNKTVNGVWLNGSGKADLSGTRGSMFIKAQGLTSSTKWLILVNKGDYKVAVFKGTGSKNSWSIVRYSSCSIGHWNRAGTGSITPSGTFTVNFKQYKRQYSLSTTWYNTYTTAGFFFHSVLYAAYDSSPTNIVDGRLGYKISESCVRLPLSECKYIYDNVGWGSKVVCY